MEAPILGREGPAAGITPEKVEEELKEYQHRADGKLLTQHDQFFADEYAQITEWLRLVPGTQVLDAGCGGGGMTAFLARSVGPTGRVIALDIDPALLETTRSQVSSFGLADRVSYRQADVTHLPFKDSEFDLVWTSRVIHGLPDPLTGLRELFRVLKPGGRLALGEGGFPLRFLPFDLGLGEPGLEARLTVIRLQWFQEWRQSQPGVVVYPFGWARLLEEAGFSQVRVEARTFLLEKLAPFTSDQESYMLGCLRDYLDIPRYRKLLNPLDLEVLERLTDPTGMAWLFNRRDLHVLSGSSVYLAYKPACWPE